MLFPQASMFILIFSLWSHYITSLILLCTCDCHPACIHPVWCRRFLQWIKYLVTSLDQFFPSHQMGGNILVPVCTGRTLIGSPHWFTGLAQVYGHSFSHNPIWYKMISHCWVSIELPWGTKLKAYWWLNHNHTIFQHPSLLHYTLPVTKVTISLLLINHSTQHSSIRDTFLSHFLIFLYPLIFLLDIMLKEF